MSEEQRFSSRWGTMLVMLGMAVGTGNIWRFPRVAATNGGGSFLFAWAIFLVLWSVPLILVEFAMGRETRRGPVGAFALLLGRGSAWMGAWVAFTATAIMFYYSVVMGWTIRYLWGSLTRGIPMTSPEAATAFWDGYVGSAAAVLTHGIAMALGVVVVAYGVRGIEKAARVLIPTLFLLVIVLAVRAVTLPGAERGLAFLFTPDWSDLLTARVWLEALTQNAWDTGAGWGLITAYAVYLRNREDTTLNAFVLGFGNNSVSLLAGIMVLCTAFAIMPEAADTIVGAGNEGLTFIWVPQLFARMPAGNLFMVLFFLALVFAAWSSLISMIELASRVLIDFGLSRARSIQIVALGGFLLGVPSALSMDFFRNQDWVWSVGLMLSGLFFATGVLRYGVGRFRARLVNRDGSDLRIGGWWSFVMGFVVLEALVLLFWWLRQALDRSDLAASLSPFSTFNVGTVLVQGGVVIAVLLAFNRRLARPFEKADEA
ncbi:MAG: sodium-dependent transporter [Candidatus Palauibacterales bacterium]|nr:sodium-dependent transporter [Candidatus Palauibacterales bacterium]MDP2482043.1 sodium-dependent transporter [Candidatus Palauibacterales bacterium]